MYSTETDLCFRPIGAATQQYDLSFPPFSARGCVQTLTPQKGASFYRTVNGKLVHIPAASHQKYVSTIVCQDQAPLACEGLWEGAALSVDCIQYLACSVQPQTKQLKTARPFVEGSPVLKKTNGESIALEQANNQTLIFEPLDQGGFLYYRPRLSMLLKSYEVKTDEWGCHCGWTMSLEEI